jgi:NADPH:quinone reductase
VSHNLRVVVPRHGGPGVLEVVEEPVPEPGPGEVRVRTRAAGVSAYDLMFRRSRLTPGTPPRPFTPGEDVVGVVDALGPGARDFEVGQLVAGTTLSLGVGGGYAAYVCLPDRELVPVPEGVDPTEAVCLVINYLTAYSALHQVAEVRSGERVLVQGAAGGVGTALLDLGRLAGLEMYGTASPDHLEVVAGYGARPIDYRREPVVRRVRELSDGGVDLVLDPIGGARQLWRSYRTLRPGGRLMWFGVAAHKQSGIVVIPASLLTLALLKVLPDGHRALTSVDYSKDNDWYRSTLAALLAHLAAGELRPIVADRIPLAEAARAHELLEHGRYAGKVVLIPA